MANVDPSLNPSNNDRQALRPALGPSPWGLPNHFTVGTETFHFVRTGAPRDKRGSTTSIQNSQGKTILVLDLYCYLRILPDGTTLLWRESETPNEKRIVFDCFSLFHLQTISNAKKIATKIRRNKLGVSLVPESQHWEFSPCVNPGIYSFSIPYDWSRFEETLVLANQADSNSPNKTARAIFAFNWILRKVEIFPQDWFNTGDYDFGYQWITRVSRYNDASIVGDGIRLGRFELDETNRRVKNWLISDKFYKLQ